MREGHGLEPQGTLCMGGCRASIQAAGFPWLPVSPEEKHRECSQLLSTFPVKAAIASTQSWRMFQRTSAFYTQETELVTENGGHVMEGWQGLYLSPLCNAVGEFQEELTRTQENCDSQNLKSIFLGRNQTECCLFAWLLGTQVAMGLLTN